jgi:hypothetical protein
MTHEHSVSRRLLCTPGAPSLTITPTGTAVGTVTEDNQEDAIKDIRKSINRSKDCDRIIIINRHYRLSTVRNRA